MNKPRAPSRVFNNTYSKKLNKYTDYHTQKSLLQDLSIFEIFIRVLSNFYQYFDHNVCRQKIYAWSVLQ